MKLTYNILISFLFCSILSFAFAGTSKQKKYYLVICAIFKNEEFYLKEWIEYHRLIGVEHFYLYDNGSTDRSVAILKPYIKAKLVDLVSYPIETNNQLDHTIHVQMPAYKSGLAIAKKTATWAAFIDVDEFIMPVKRFHLKKILRKYEEFGGLCINWQNYGTSFMDSLAPGELIIEKLIWKSFTNALAHRMVKTIVQPTRVRAMHDPHAFFYEEGYYAVNSNKQPLPDGRSYQEDILTDIIRINHYWFGTRNWFINHKIPRRKKWGLNILPEMIDDIISTGNQEIDESMLRFVPALKKRYY